MKLNASKGQSLPDRHFYHSFPRRQAGQRDSRSIGLAILDSVCRNGFLLTPEKVSWRDPTVDPANRTEMLQRRISFTELSSAEVEAHSLLFGEFSLEFPVPVLRSLGALPVIYIPDHVDVDPHGALGVSILANLAATRAVLSELSKIIDLNEPALKMTLTMGNGEHTVHEFDPAEFAAIKSYLGYLGKAQGISFTEMRGALDVMASLFYPTDDLQHSGTLTYYRQREWRIISGQSICGNATTAVATEAQREELLALDRGFFSKELEFPNGSYSLAAKSHFFSHVNGEHVLRRASRLVAPKTALADAEMILSKHGFAVPAVALEDFAGRCD